MDKNQRRKQGLPSTLQQMWKNGRDWRVFLVGHLGYDSYDEEESDEEELSEDEFDHELYTQHEQPRPTMSSNSFISGIKRTLFPEKKPIATVSNRKRKHVEHWIEVKALRDKRIQQISAGGYHVVVLMDDGSVYCWGWGKLGQLGVGDMLNRTRPVRIHFPFENENPHVTQPTAQPMSTHVQTHKEPLLEQPALLSPAISTSPQFIQQQIKVVKVKGGGRHTIILTNDGRVWTFGCGEDGRLGHGDNVDCMAAKEVNALRGYRVSFVDSAFWHTIVATECKKVFVFGHGEEGKLGLGNNQSQFLPVEVNSLRGIGIQSASGGAWHTILLTEDERVLTMGSHYWGQLGIGQNPNVDDIQKSSLSNISPQMSPSKDALYTPVEIVALRNKGIIKVIAGSNFNVCLSRDGKVYTFGCGSSGKTGHASNATLFIPKRIDTLGNVKIKDIATGSNHTLLLGEQGRLYTFGWCRYGQLGHGNTEEVDVPKVVEALKDIHVEQITAGAFFTLVATRNPYKSSAVVFTPNNYQKMRRSFCNVLLHTAN